MKFIADESVDKQIILELRNNGIQIKYIAEISPGISDMVVLNLAKNDNTMLITADKDFGELVFRQNKLTSGGVLFRLHGLSQIEKSKIVSKTILEHTRELVNSFTVISKESIRIRHLFS